MPEDINTATETVNKYLNIYKHLPPFVCSVIGFAIMRDDVAFEPFNTEHMFIKDEDRIPFPGDRGIEGIEQNNIHPIGYSDFEYPIINTEWWNTVINPALFGYVVLYANTRIMAESGIKTIINACFESPHAARRSIKNLENKLINISNTALFCGASSAAYGLLGEYAMGQLENISDVTNTATTHFVGGLTIPLAAKGIGWLYSARQKHKATQEIDNITPLLEGQQNINMCLTP